MLTRAQCITWIADLRSGKFAQTKSRLKDNVGYCCLGVLGEQINPVLMQKSGGSLNYLCESNSFDIPIPDSIKLPYKYVADGDTHLGAAEGVLMMLNDGHHWSFSMIADHIEKHLLPQLKD